jgi:hypothetical protein
MARASNTFLNVESRLGNFCCQIMLALQGEKLLVAMLFIEREKLLKRMSLIN